MSSHLSLKSNILNFQNTHPYSAVLQTLLLLICLSILCFCSYYHISLLLFSPEISIRIMIFHMSVRSNPMLRKTNLAVWRAWRSWKLSLHSSTVCASSGPGPGPLDRSEELSPVSTEKPPHTPVMLKEVLQYLDIQLGQVGLHPNYFCKLFGVF